MLDNPEIMYFSPPGPTPGASHIGPRDEELSCCHGRPRGALLRPRYPPQKKKSVVVERLLLPLIQFWLKPWIFGWDLVKHNLSFYCPPPHDYNCGGSYLVSGGGVIYVVSCLLQDRQWMLIEASLELAPCYKITKPEKTAPFETKMVGSPRGFTAEIRRAVLTVTQKA